MNSTGEISLKTLSKHVYVKDRSLEIMHSFASEFGDSSIFLIESNSQNFKYKVTKTSLLSTVFGYMERNVNNLSLTLRKLHLELSIIQSGNRHSNRYSSVSQTRELLRMTK